MNNEFASYVNARLTDHNVVSVVEKQLISAVDKYDIAGNVKMLYIRENSLTLYEAAINTSATPKRVKITSIGDEIPHNLHSILGNDLAKRKIRNSLFAFDNQEYKWMFDDYFSSYEDLKNIIADINRTFDNLHLSGNDHIIVAENFYNDEAVVNFALQSYVGRMYTPVSLDGNISIRGRIELDQAITSMKVGANFPMNNIWGLMVNKQNIYVPLQDSTLQSRFYKHLSWQDILGEMASEDSYVAEISGCKCRVVRLSLYIDCYGNIFLTVSSVLDSREHIMLIDGPGLQLSPSASENQVESSCAHASQSVTKPAHEEQAECESNDTSNDNNNRKKQNSGESNRANHPAKKKEPSKEKKSEMNPSEQKIIFDGKTIDVGLIESKISEMTNKNQLYVYVNIIDGVFKKMAKVERIVTDTNVWITEDPTKKGDMKHKGMLDLLIKYMKAGKNTFEALPEVYDEIVKLAKSDTAAARKAKNFISTCQEMRLIDFPDLSWDYNDKAYADSKIGERVVKLYNDGTLFSIITNDTDAKIRWINALQNLEKETHSDESRPFPPCILCRDLHSLFILRGKLIKQLNSLKNNK